MAAVPQSGLSVLVSEKKVNDLLEQRTGLRALLRSSCNVFLFVLFLMLYTVLALSEDFPGQRAFEHHLRRRFDLKAPLPVLEVESAADFWQYTQQSLLPAIYGNDTRKYYYPGTVVEKLLPMEGGNRLFGVARLRSLKVVPDDGCRIAERFSSRFKSCYGPYSVSAEDRAPFGPIADDGQPEFRYVNADGHQFTGKLATYSSSGFMRALTSNYDQTLQSIRKMESQGFLAANTRAIFYEFTVYNFNLGLYAVIRLAFEVAPSGRWLPMLQVDVFSQRHLGPLGFGSTMEWLLLVGEALLVLFVFRYVFEELSELWGMKKKCDYFMDAWNLLDWTNLILIVTTLIYRIDTWSLASDVSVYVGDPAEQSASTFTNMYSISNNVRIIRGLLAFNAVLTWFKAVKYVNVVPYVSLFMQTVTRSQRHLAAFIIVFCTCFFGFIVAFNVAFGQSATVFRTGWKSGIFLLRTFLGDTDFSIVYDAAPFMGTLLMVAFIFGIFFVILGLFSAIMISALADALRFQDKEQTQQWANTVERLQQLGTGIYDRLLPELPGLYSQVLNRRKKRDELEQLRDQAHFQRQLAKMPDDLLALGPGSPTYGRRQRKALASVAIKDEDSDGSEADLGPLFTAEQLQIRDADDGGIPASPLGLPKAGPGLGEQPSDPREPPPQVVQLIISATSHVAGGVVERTRGARAVLFGEMADSRDVLLGISSVLHVLVQRSQHLEAQQEDLLRRYERGAAGSTTL